jgi:2,3-bisphosphoglycerate-dependent phosphoglycerate mutase
MAPNPSPNPHGLNLVIVRHGESEWNRKNLFTGWRDVRLTDLGREEAREAGRLLRAQGFRFDVAYTSVLSRAIETLWLALDEMDLMWLPVIKHWRLNERHYGALTGLNKAESVAKFGEAQVKDWRRGYATRPPPVDPTSPDYPKGDPRYAALADNERPQSESLKDVLARVLPYWSGTIVPELKAGKRVLVAAHGNSLRALMKHLEGISDDAIAEVNLPTGSPRGYRLDASFSRAEDARYLGDAAAIAAKAKAVAEQTKRA